MMFVRECAVFPYPPPPPPSPDDVRGWAFQTCFPLCDEDMIGGGRSQVMKHSIVKLVTGTLPLWLLKPCRDAKIRQERT